MKADTKLKQACFGVLGLCALGPSLAVAYPIVPYPGESAPNVGATIVATGGDVTATFLSGSGAYDNYLYLDNSATYSHPATGVAPTGNWIFENHISSAGNTVDLGVFAPGTVLQFHVVSDTHGGGFLDWYTGAAALNADGLPHAFVDSSASAVLANGGSVVGFEDLAGLGDAGFEDLRYAFSNTESVPAPDAGTSFGMLGMALSALFMARRSIRK